MRMPRPRRAISVRGAALALSLLVAVAVALVLLLRGTDKPSVSKAAYSRALSARLTRLAVDFQAAGSGGDASATSASLRRMKSAIDRAAAGIAQLSAPA